MRLDDLRTCLGDLRISSASLRISFVRSPISFESLSTIDELNRECQKNCGAVRGAKRQRSDEQRERVEIADGTIERYGLTAEGGFLVKKDWSRL